MFNPEKLLGGLIKSSTRGKSGLSGLIPGGAALGVVGVAMAAAEHFMNKPKQQASGPPPAFSPGQTPPAGPGMPPGAPTPAGPGAAPPPPPGGAGPAAPPAAAPLDTEQNQEAVLLIQAMIAAANADGTIDEKERSRILGRLKSVDLSPEEQSFITHELLSPADLDTIASKVNNPETARQVYAVSLMAIEIDTDAEKAYMQSLAGKLDLDESTIAGIHEKLELD